MHPAESGASPEVIVVGMSSKAHMPSKPEGAARVTGDCCDGVGEAASLVDVRRYERVEQDVLCPVCGALPRHRILAWRLSRSPELVQGKRVLYFAPEESMVRWMRRHGVAFTTADLCQPADLKLDMQSTGLDAESWDVVVCNHVLEHVGDWQAALAELRRILAPGGPMQAHAVGVVDTFCRNRKQCGARLSSVPANPTTLLENPAKETTLRAILAKAPGPQPHCCRFRQAQPVG